MTWLALWIATCLAVALVRWIAAAAQACDGLAALAGPEHPP